MTREIPGGMRRAGQRLPFQQGVWGMKAGGMGPKERREEHEWAVLSQR